MCRAIGASPGNRSSVGGVKKSLSERISSHQVSDILRRKAPHHSRRIKHHAIGLAWETVRVSPRCWKMFNKVPRLGVVLQDSILATED